MAFIAEDGTGIAGANSLVPVAFADAYFADRGDESWEFALPDEKQAALIIATDFVSHNFSFRGERKFEEQELPFPRIIDGEKEMPSKMLKAVSEYAKRAIDGVLQPDPTFDAAGRQIKSSTNKLGPLSTTVTFTDFDPSKKVLPFPKADAMLSSLLTSRTNINFLVR